MFCFFVHVQYVWSSDLDLMYCHSQTDVTTRQTRFCLKIRTIFYRSINIGVIFAVLAIILFASIAL